MSAIAGVEFAMRIYGSNQALTSRDAPIAQPNTAPSGIPTASGTRRRCRVAPRCSNSSPVSVMYARPRMTSIGSGKSSGVPTKAAATCQRMKNRRIP